MSVWSIWYQQGWESVKWSIGKIVKAELPTYGDGEERPWKMPEKKLVTKYAHVFLEIDIIFVIRRSKNSSGW